MVEALIDRERERGIDASRIVLMGFSQGCAMTLMAGLRYGHRLAGLVGSLRLPAAGRRHRGRAACGEPRRADLPRARQRGPGHPDCPRHRFARRAQAAAATTCEWHEYPMAHSVCAEEIVDLNRWLLEILA